jgi:hypothetical protein
VVEGVTLLAELRAQGTYTVAIELAARELPADVMSDVASVVASHPGGAPVLLRYTGPDGSETRWRSRSLKVAASSAALNELRALLGETRVRLERGS